MELAIYDDTMMQPIDPLRDFALPGDPIIVGPTDFIPRNPIVPIESQGEGYTVSNTEAGLETVPPEVPTTTTTTPTDILKSNPLLTAGLLFAAAYFLGAFKKIKI